MEVGPGVGEGGEGWAAPVADHHRLDVALRDLREVDGELCVPAWEGVYQEAALVLLLSLRVRLQPVLVDLK